jgi:signal transduction histidine kinase
MMLVYMVAAMGWWLFSLLQQNDLIARTAAAELELRKPLISDRDYSASLEAIAREKKRNAYKYIAEGITFFILLFLGAVFVFRSVRRQFMLQLQQRNFMMAVTHELKTPISVVKLNLETLQRYSLDPEKQRKLLKTTLEENARLNTLTSNILVSSQLEGAGHSPTREELDLGDLLKDRIQDFRDRYPDHRFLETIEDDTDVEGDALLLQMMINNLLENAVKYSPKESTITASLYGKNRHIFLEITDEGPGIPPSEQAKIFDKFYRIGNEETRRAAGTGLGLYLCRKIAQDHDADISVTNLSPRGSKFAVRFRT